MEKSQMEQSQMEETPMEQSQIDLLAFDPDSYALEAALTSPSLYTQVGHVYFIIS